MFITGCHRSGTSLLAALLAAVLQRDQKDRSQLEPALDNPRGFFESKRLVDLNDHLLESLGCSWNRPPLLAPAWGDPPFLDELASERSRWRDLALSTDWLDKDPRLCITYPAFVHLLLRRVPLLAAIRSPLAVAGSLYARNGMPINAGLSFWFVYNHHLAGGMEPSDPVIAYQDLLQARDDAQQSAEVFDRILVVLEEGRQQRTDFSSWTKALQRHLKPSLDRATDVLPTRLMSAVNPALLESCERAYRCVVERGRDGAAMAAAFDALPRVVLEIQNQYGVCADGQPEELARLRQELEQLHRNQIDNRAEKDQLEKRLQALQASSSWRLTAPIRSIFKRLGR